jgi:hypothetical protein
MSVRRANPSLLAGKGAARRKARGRTSFPKQGRTYISVEWAVIAGAVGPTLRSFGVF